MRSLAGWLLKILGWKTVGDTPQLSHCVLIVAPHTSNWDFIIGILFKMKRKIKLNYFGKDTLFRWYNSWFFKFFGGQPVIRHKSHNVVKDKVAIFKKSPRFWLALAPEGTRAYGKYWRSGFYHIALEADVPVVLIYLDASCKEVGFGPTIKLSGDIEKDLEIIRDFYKDKKGINDEKTSLIRFKEK